MPVVTLENTLVLPRLEPASPLRSPPCTWPRSLVGLGPHSPAGSHHSCGVRPSVSEFRT
jgi:hypothetical protein